MQSIPFSTMKGFSRLVQAFVQDETFRSQRFPSNAQLHSKAYCESASQRVSAQGRQNIVAAIRTTMQHLSLTAAQEAHLETLLDAKSTTIISGQQPVIAGGALYCAYKAASAIHHARTVQSMHTDIPVVPVYWVEDNDHDIEEIATSYTMDSNSIAHAISYHHSASVRYGVGDIQLTESIATLAQQVQTWHGAVPQEHNLFAESYPVGGTFTQGFIRILNVLFADDGLLFVSSKVLRSMGLMQSIIAHDASVPNATNIALERGSAQVVEAGFHAQVQGADVNFFFHDAEAGRIKVKQRSDGSYQRGSTIVSHTELCADVQTNPALYSSTVVIRPVIQDTLFPNLAYIAGPGELAYFAQFKEVYEHFGLTMPAILLRHNATIIPEKLLKGLDVLGGWTALLTDANVREHHFTTYLHTTDSIAALQSYKTSIADTFATIKRDILAIDATLQASISGAEKRIHSAIEHSIHKAVKAEKRKSDTIVARARTASAWVYPNNHLQERTLSVLWGIHALGIERMRALLRDMTERSAHEHTLILL